MPFNEHGFEANDASGPIIAGPGNLQEPGRKLAEYHIHNDLDVSFEALQRSAVTLGVKQEAAYNETRLLRAEYDQAVADIQRYEDERAALGQPVDPATMAHLQRVKATKRNRLDAGHEASKVCTKGSAAARTVYGAALKKTSKLCNDGVQVERVFAEVPNGATREGERAKRKALRAEAEAINRSTGGIEEDRRVLYAGVDARIAECMPRVSWHGAKVHLNFPVQGVNAAAVSARSELPHIEDGLPLALLATRDAVLADIDRQLAAHYEGKPKVLTHASRAKRLNQIADEILQSERVEAQILWDKLEAGEDVWFPTDLDIRAVLRIA